MPFFGRLALMVVVIALLATPLFGGESRGQVTLPLRHEPEAAVPGLPAIAHGVVTMPADEIGWTVVVRRAVPPYRATAARRTAGFVLAQEGAIAVADADGAPTTRLAPGEAAWVATETELAVVSLEARAVAYVEIALRPAADLVQGGQNLAIGLPFAAPSGAAFPLELLRGVLARDAESTIGAGTTPSLLLVTRGAVWITLPTGETRQLTTGAATQVDSDVILTGASRTPASVVVARAGEPLPARFTLKNGTPQSQAAPAATPVPDAAGTDAATIPVTDRVDADTNTDTDTDGDGLPDARELTLGTDPAAIDSDSDGLNDRDEIEFYGTDPLAADTDGDGLDDGEELLNFGTNPLLADTDGDGLADGDEAVAGTDPLAAASLPVTEAVTPAAATPSPAAGPDTLPIAEATPAAADALPPGDLDGDGLSNADEVEIYGTDPKLVDSDGDGYSDGGEVMAGTDPLDPFSPP